MNDEIKEKYIRLLSEINTINGKLKDLKRSYYNISTKMNDTLLIDNKKFGENILDEINARNNKIISELSNKVPDMIRSKI